MLSCCQVLNYGQSVFEGMKAQRSAKNRIVLFRPQENAARMIAGAKRLSMAPLPADLFVSAVQQLVRDNQDYVPPQVWQCDATLLLLLTVSFGMWQVQLLQCDIRNPVLQQTEHHNMSAKRTL